MRRGSHSWSIHRTNFILQEYFKYVSCCCLVLSRTLCGMINIIGNKLHPDFRLPTPGRWGLHSSETFWGLRYVRTFRDHIGYIFKCQALQKQCFLDRLTLENGTYVVPKRRALATDLRRTTSQKSQDLKRRQVIPKLRTGWVMITYLFVPTAVCRFLLILSENLKDW